MTAYVIDTGIRLDHAEFGGRAVSGFDAVDGGTADDCDGHGTHVAGTVGGSTYGVAKGVALVAVRVLDCTGSGSWAGVIAGVEWVTANAVKPAVANMSLGGGASSSVDTAVRNSIASGVSYAVAAGNSNKSACNYSPARVGEAMTIGATTSTDARASYSNYGSCVDFFAPGSRHRADLSWSGAASTNVDVFRNGSRITTTTNDGAHTDNIGKRGGGSYTYKVCNAGSTTCSADVTVTF